MCSFGRNGKLTGDDRVRSNGKVLLANKNFAGTKGYRIEEMPGLMHKRFCTAEFTGSREYMELWRNHRSGKSFQEKIQRVTKKGQLLWLEATYSPVYVPKVKSLAW